MDSETGLFLLFSSSFLSATLLPGSSEALLIATILEDKVAISTLVIVASIGNSLGGFSNYLIGLFFPESERINSNKQITRVRRYGPYILLLSWLPFVGDAFCLAAGYLRFNWLFSLLVISLAKFLRYSFIAYAVTQL